MAQHLKFEQSVTMRIYLYEKYVEWLSMKAIEEGTSKSDIIRQLIEEKAKENNEQL